jgi:general secretion pathway protein J
VSSRRHDAGFTLLELLVAMTVLGVLTGLLASGLSFGTRIWERERNQLDATSELQLVQDVLRRMLTQALPLSAPSETSRPEESPFVGSSNSIEFLGPPPAQSLAGGVYGYRLSTRIDPEGMRLVLEWWLRPPQGTKVRTKVTNAALGERDRLLGEHEVILLDALSNVEFAFFGASEDGSTTTWRNEWHDATKLPQLVRLKISFRPGDRRIWPDLLVAPRITLETNE